MIVPGCPYLYKGEYIVIDDILEDGEGFAVTNLLGKPEPFLIKEEDSELIFELTPETQIKNLYMIDMSTRFVYYTAGKFLLDRYKIVDPDQTKAFLQDLTEKKYVNSMRLRINLFDHDFTKNWE